MTRRTDACTAIAQLNKQLHAVNRQLQHAVKVARRQGASWQAIGEALGISRQSAWEQFRQLEAS
jgi:biotin operon repressor